MVSLEECEVVGLECGACGGGCGGGGGGGRWNRKKMAC